MMRWAIGHHRCGWHGGWTRFRWWAVMRGRIHAHICRKAKP